MHKYRSHIPVIVIVLLLSTATLARGEILKGPGALYNMSPYDDAYVQFGNGDSHAAIQNSNSSSDYWDYGTYTSQMDYTIRYRFRYHDDGLQSESGYYPIIYGGNIDDVNAGTDVDDAFEYRWAAVVPLFIRPYVSLDGIIANAAYGEGVYQGITSNKAVWHTDFTDWRLVTEVTGSWDSTHTITQDIFQTDSDWSATYMSDLDRTSRYSGDNDYHLDTTEEYPFFLIGDEEEGWAAGMINETTEYLHYYSTWLYTGAGPAPADPSLWVLYPEMDVLAAAIPEPISLIFFGTGLIGVIGFVTRRRMCKA